MVCLGNICRSPMAEGIMRAKITARNLNWKVDSAGTGAWHAGEHPDPRAIRTAKKFGIDISKQIARQFQFSDFEDFDQIFVMDQNNLRDVLALARNQEDIKKVRLLLDYHPKGTLRDVPDPWFGEYDGFKVVFEMIDMACENFLKHYSND